MAPNFQQRILKKKCIDQFDNECFQAETKVNIFHNLTQVNFHLLFHFEQRAYSTANEKQNDV